MASIGDNKAVVQELEKQIAELESNTNSSVTGEEIERLR